MDSEGPPARLSRTNPRTSSVGSRLSFALRRSLRLSPKRTTFHEIAESVSKDGYDTEKYDTSQKEATPAKVGNCFTPYAAVKIESYSKRYGTVSELSRLLQLARKTPIKKFLRYNDWPLGHDVRQELWKELCRDRDYDANLKLYKIEVEELSHKGHSLSSIKASFVSAAGSVINDFDLNEEGKTALQRLLLVIECVRPDITFVPILYPLCAVFLHYLKEEDAFACAMHLLRGSEYLQQSSISVLASGRTLLALIKKHKSSVHSALKKCAGVTDDKDLVKLFMRWQNWIFEYLPLSHVVRVVDCFLFEGHKLLLRVGLALVYIWSKSKARKDADFLDKSIEERLTILSAQLLETSKTCPVSVQTLLDVAVGIRNLKGSTVAKYQKTFEDMVREEEASKVESPDSVVPVSPSAKISGYVYAKPFRSNIIDSSNANALMCSFPDRLQFDTPQLLFLSSTDGISFTNFWTKIEDAEQTLIVILTSKKDVFGAFCSTPWAERKDRRTKARYFGTGESFVWRLDRDSDTPVVYHWVGQTSEHPDQCPQYFMAADEKTLIIGGGNGDAILIRDELYKGLTSYCSTFNSPALTDERDFIISELEVFGVQCCSA